MKILLVNPPHHRLQQMGYSYFPLGLGYLASALRANGFTVAIYNAEHETQRVQVGGWEHKIRYRQDDKYHMALEDPGHYVWREVEQVLKDYNPSIVGISSATVTYRSALKIASIAKNLNPMLPVVMGGPHPTVVPEDVLREPNIDFVVIGEGEETLVELVNMLAQGEREFQHIDGLAFKRGGRVFINQPRAFIQNLDNLGFPARDLDLFESSYQPNVIGGHLIASRGCAYNCSFCSSKAIWGRKVRRNSPGHVVKEMWEMVNRYGTYHFNFNDDEFMANRKWLIELCENIIETGLSSLVTWRANARVNHVDSEILKIMKKAGCIMLEFGIESGSDRILKEMNKGITVEQAQSACRLVREAGIHVHAYFMAGIPQETLEDLQLTMRLMQKIGADTIMFTIFSPFPGTQLYDYAIAKGLLTPDTDMSLYSMFRRNNCLSHNIDREDYERMIYAMEELSDKINSRTMMRFSWRWRLHHKRLWRDPSLYSDILIWGAKKMVPRALVWKSDDKRVEVHSPRKGY